MRLLQSYPQPAMLVGIVFLLATSLSDAVSLRLVRIACERDPTLHFCDSHILGNPVTSTENPIVSTTKPSISPSGEVPGLSTKEQDQFLTWLADLKDEVADPEIDTEELETSHRRHNNVAVYCNKYRPNFDHYCKDSDVEKLEGVLPQFCSVYGRHCGIDEDDFPTPAPLVGSKQQFKAEVAPAAQTATTDSPNNYCEKFSMQYEQLCSKESRTGMEDFCKSYKKTCEKISNPPSGDSSSVAKEIDELEPSPTEEADGGAPSGTKGGMRDAPKSSRITKYCEKFWDNFNYFCAGENSEEHESFCQSYRTNCPEKVGS